MDSQRLKVTFIQSQQSEGGEKLVNLRLQASAPVPVDPMNPSPSPYGSTTLSLVLSGDGADDVQTGDEFDLTLTPASGT